MYIFLRDVFKVGKKGKTMASIITDARETSNDVLRSIQPSQVEVMDTTTLLNSIINGESQGKDYQMVIKYDPETYNLKINSSFNLTPNMRVIMKMLSYEKNNPENNIIGSGEISNEAVLGKIKAATETLTIIGSDLVGLFSLIDKNVEISGVRPDSDQMKAGVVVEQVNDAANRMMSTLLDSGLGGVLGGGLGGVLDGDDVIDLSLIHI